MKESWRLCTLIFMLTGLCWAASCVAAAEEPAGQKETTFKLKDIDAERIIITKLVPRFESEEKYYPIFDRIKKDVTYGAVNVPVGITPVVVEIGDVPYSQAEKAFTNECVLGVAGSIAIEEAAKSASELDLVKLFLKMYNEVLPPFVEANARWSRFYPSQDSGLVYERALDTMQFEDFAFDGSDRVITTIQDRKINLIPILSLFENPLEAVNYSINDSKLYSKYIKEAVERYDGDGIVDCKYLRYPIKMWQFEDHPDSIYYRRQRENFMLPSQYVRALKATHKAIKAADKSAQVVLGSMQPSYRAAPDAHSIEYLKALGGLGVEEYYDLFAFDFAPVSEDLQIVDDYVRAYREALGTEKKFVVGRLIINSSPLPDRSVEYEFITEEAQARNLVRFTLCLLTRGAQKVLWSQMEDEAAFEKMNAKAGLIDRFGGRKTSFYTFQTLAQKLNGSDIDNIDILADGDEGIYAFRLHRKDIDKDLFILWKEKD